MAIQLKGQVEYKMKKKSSKELNHVLQIDQTTPLILYVESIKDVDETLPIQLALLELLSSISSLSFHYIVWTKFVLNLLQPAWYMPLSNNVVRIV